ncbi:hypothetical protein [Rheinheimera salexigens]|uniref:Uncharacterized protein n=1 Tax=Rheinheimera salexigens TaxID=1628148 RepID=A0A1E7Q416_9GAMM|nr:hypothetical protein [Rheinheimera salexigens]OEY68860.1 hypothetical protein BI198_04235 [Rheinheimera salexigens]
MEPQIYWYELLFMGLLVSMMVAYPTVALFVTRPIQRKLRQTQQDYLSDWVKWPFQTIFYTLAVLVSFTRWRHENNRHLVDADELVRQAATPVQWWLSLWLAVSTCGMAILGLSMAALDYISVW